MSGADAVVVGAGIAGLACARRLTQEGLDVVVLEAGTEVGGRVRTDEVDGFRLDHGFQVLPVAYPEARAILDYDRLDLQVFERGAIVRLGGKFHTVPDPRRSPVGAARALVSGAVMPRDALAVRRLLQGSERETTARDALREAGLSAHAERFLGAFLRGIFLERELSTSSSFLEFVLQTFSAGPAAVPARGMSAIAEQLAEGVEPRTEARVSEVAPGSVRLSDGQSLQAPAVVVAVSGLIDDEPPAGWNGVCCLYFDAPEPPLPGAWLVLDGDGTGPVNNLTTLTETAPAYGPPGRALVSVSGVGADEPDVERIRHQLKGWFGSAVAAWRLLQTYTIPRALPAYPVGARFERPARIEPGLYACGDHRSHPSLNGALRSGWLAAVAVVSDLS